MTQTQPPDIPVATFRQYEAIQGEGSGRIRLLITVIDGEVIEVAERAVGDRCWSRPLPLSVVTR